MRYADGPIVAVTVQIDAPPSQVWYLVSDIETPAHFSTELYEVGWLGNSNHPVPGALFAGRNRRPPGIEWQTTAQVITVEPERLFTWRIRSLDGEFSRPAATWGFELIPEGSGTRLREWARIGPGRSGVNSVIDSSPESEEQIVANRLRELQRGIRITLDGIRMMAEAAARSQNPHPPSRPR